MCLRKTEFIPLLLVKRNRFRYIVRFCKRNDFRSALSHGINPRYLRLRCLRLVLARGLDLNIDAGRQAELIFASIVLAVACMISIKRL